jgi:hypothetical protein
MTSKELILRMKLKDPSALEAIRKALATGKGVRAAVVKLGISRAYIYQAANDWAALARLLKKGAMDPCTRGQLGGTASAKARR